MNCSSFSHKHGGFQFPRRLSHLDERRRSREQRFSALARRAAYGFAPCRPAPKRAGRRAARVGIVQRGCAVLYVADLQECEKCGVSAEDSGKTGIEKAAAPADEGARKPRSG